MYLGQYVDRLCFDFLVVVLSIDLIQWKNLLMVLESGLVWFRMGSLASGAAVTNRLMVRVNAVVSVAA